MSIILFVLSFITIFCGIDLGLNALTGAYPGEALILAVTLLAVGMWGSFTAGGMFAEGD